MDLWRTTVILVVCVLWMPTPGSALKCYVCNSLHDDACTKLSGDKHLKDCSEVTDDRHEEGFNHTNCRRQTFEAVSKEFGMEITRTIRSCGYEKHPRLSCFFSSNIDLKSETCECTEDACNTANLIKSLPTGISLFLALICIITQSIT